MECSSDPEESSVTIADEQHVPSSPIKRVRVSIPHLLRSFCEVRWYSAWIVMSRFYELYDSLQTVTTIRRDAKDKKLKSFVTTLEKVNKEELIRTLNYLYPLVKPLTSARRIPLLVWR